MSQKSTLTLRGTANAFTFVEEDGSRRRAASIAGISVAKGALTEAVWKTLASLKAGDARKVQGDAKGVVLPLGEVEAEAEVVETTVPAKRDALGNITAEETVQRYITELRSVKRWTVDYSAIDAAFGDIDALLA